MAEIKDFKCGYGNSSGINSEVTALAGVTLPEAHLHAESIVKLSLAMKQHDGAAFCELPFCHTLEADALGGIINLGDYNTGPRAKEYITKKMEDILDLQPIDFSKGRIHEVLEAATILRNQGEEVIMEITGPITILNTLIDAKYVFKTLRRNPELMQQVLDKICEEIYRFMVETKKRGVRILSFSDVVCSVDVLGPEACATLVDMYLYPLFKRAEALADENTMIMMCPKCTFQLIGTEKAQMRDVELSGALRYGEACIEMIGKVKFAGMQCFKNIDYVVGNGIFKEVVLL